MFFILHAEFKGVSQTRATEGASDWLDLVLPGDRLLQKEVGGGPGHGLQGPGRVEGLPRVYVGRYMDV